MARRASSASAKLSPDMSKLAVVAAGGTGGHLFPAQALAEALAQPNASHPPPIG